MPSDTSEAEKAANTDGPPPAERRRLEREPLDFSPSSGPVGATQKVGEDDSVGPQDFGNNKTTFDPNEAKQEGWTVFGRNTGRWEWLKRLNQTGENSDRRYENRERGRLRDITLMIDSLDITDPHREEQLHNITVNIYHETSKKRKDGIRFGGKPEEIALIAIISIAARRITDSEVDKVDELNEDDMIHTTALGQHIDGMCESWIPMDYDYNTNEVRKTREKIVQSHKNE